MNQKGFLFHNPFLNPFILCNNAGALFLHAVADNTTVSDILRPNYVPIVHSFFPLNGVRNHEGTSQPLLAVQVTELIDGVFIGCTMNHVVADGMSFWHFISSWAEISRGCSQLSKRPTLERWFLNDINYPIRFPFTMTKEKNPNPVLELPPERIFHFTKEKIAQLKSKANAEANSTTNKIDKIEISYLQALLIHVWSAVIRCSAQLIDPQEEICCGLAIGVRGRMIPPLPENYFGNAILVDAVIVKAGEFLEGGFGNVAWEMNKVIASYSDYTIKRHYESWVKTPGLFQTQCGRRLGSVKALATSSSPRFDIYFGWGKPVAVRSGCSNKRNATVTVFSGAEEGSIDVEVCLSYEILEAIGNDPDFIGIL